MSRTSYSIKKIVKLDERIKRKIVKIDERRKSVWQKLLEEYLETMNQRVIMSFWNLLLSSKWWNIIRQKVSNVNGRFDIIDNIMTFVKKINHKYINIVNPENNFQSPFHPMFGGEKTKQESDKQSRWDRKCERKKNKLFRKQREKKIIYFKVLLNNQSVH